MPSKSQSSEKRRPMLSLQNGSKPIWTFVAIMSFAKKRGPLLLAISGINECLRKASQVKRGGQCYHCKTDLNRFGHLSPLCPLQKNGVPCYWQFQESMNAFEKPVK